MRFFFFVFFFSNISAFSQNPVNSFYKGDRDGDHMSYYIDGTIKMEWSIKNGNLHGDRCFYYENGKLCVREQFYDGEFHGTNYMLRKNGDTAYIEKYRHDTLCFTNNFYYFITGKLKGKSTVWYRSDSTLIKNPFVVRNAIDGININLDLLEKTVNNFQISKTFYRSGQIKTYAELEYNEGLVSGKSIEYYSSGKIKISNNYKDSKRDGEHLKYNSSGQLVKKEIFKNGIIQK